MTCVLVCACRLRCVHWCICFCSWKVEYIVCGKTCIEIKTLNNTNAQLSSWQKDRNASRSTTTHCKKIKPHASRQCTEETENRRNQARNTSRGNTHRSNTRRSIQHNQTQKAGVTQSTRLASKLTTIQLLLLRSMHDTFPIEHQRRAFAERMVVRHKQQPREDVISNSAKPSGLERRINAH